MRTTGWVALMVAFGLMCSFATAAVIFTETWDTGLIEGWDIDDQPDNDGGAPFGSDPLVNPSDWLRVIGDTNPGGAASDYMFADSGASGGSLAGNLNYSGTGLGVQGIGFRFNNPAAAPAAELVVYFHSDTSERTWFFPSLSINAGGWNTYGVNFGDSLSVPGGSWFTEGGDGETQWDADIVDIDYIGIRITYIQGVPGQIYGLDDFYIDNQLLVTFVPEPETYAMLGFAILSLGFTFRRKLDGSLHAALAQLKS